MFHRSLRGLRTCSSSMTMKRSSPPLRNCSAGAYQVLGARNVTEALAIIRRGQIAVVMADQRMPGKRLRAARPRRRSGARCDTDLDDGGVDLDAVMQAINREDHYYVSKPWEPNELEAIIDKPSNIIISYVSGGV
jgi:DNA-binding NtrC family response regulator